MTTSHTKKIPFYKNKLPPCNHACPAGENIQAWINSINEGRLYEAWRTIMENNPFPAIHGRVCYFPCENACNRKEFDETVSIHNLERFIGDVALAEKWQINIISKADGKKIMVIGAGPTGLAAAYHLRRLGYQVTIYEKENYTGGVMRSGIPAFRLPRSILDGEIERLEKLGIKIILNHAITDLNATIERHGFAAAFIAVGAQKDKMTPIAGDNQHQIFGAMEFLRAVSVNTGFSACFAKHNLAVYGGGNTALDVARTAKRLGLKKVHIIYRRDRSHMPAFQHEVEETLAEGVEFHFLRTIRSFQENVLSLEIMTIDDQGKAQPTGRFETLTAEQLILTLGQDADTDFLANLPNLKRAADGTILTDHNLMTAVPAIFAGGDAVTTNRSVTIGVGHGKKAALQIDAYLKQQTVLKAKPELIASYATLHLQKMGKTAGVKSKTLDVIIRNQSFDEVQVGIEKEEFFQEAKRCFSCGNCFGCDTCLDICPVNSISIAKTNPEKRYAICAATCIGCGKCVRKCPSGAMAMTKLA